MSRLADLLHCIANHVRNEEDGMRPTGQLAMTEFEEESLRLLNETTNYKKRRSN